jgi:CarD family transcriptional regulator
MASSQGYKKGDKAVYPAHGVGEVIDIQIRSLGGTERSFYVLSILENGMKVMVPVETAAQAGLRPVMTRKDAKKVMEVLAADEVAVKTQPWNRRYREYMEKIKTGSVFEIAEVLRDLQRLKGDKELSFGERKMLDTARTLLVKEIAVATKSNEGKIEEKLNRIFAC